MSSVVEVDDRALSKARRWLWAWCAVVVVGHALFLNAAPVNLEFAFQEAAKTLATPDYSEGADRYFTYQANPLGFSLLTAGLWKLTHLPPSFWSPRLLSLAGAIAVLYSGYQWFRLFRPGAIQLFNLWAAVTALCPLMWIYTGRGTADVLPAGLVCLAITWCCQARGRLAWHLLAANCFVLASIVKFNALLVGVGFLYLVYREPGSLRERVRNAACYALLPTAALIVYFTWLYARFNIFLLNTQFQTIHNPVAHVHHYWAVLGLYVSYLAMLPGLLTLRPLLLLKALPSTRAKMAAMLAGLALSVVLGVALSTADIGEMKFGGFDYLLPPLVFASLRGACLVLGAAIVAEMLYRAWAKHDELSGLLVAAVIPFLLISSGSRPAQRYLLICLPLVLFYLTALTPRSLRRATQGLGWSSALVFTGLSAVGCWYTLAQGNAAERTATWIAEHGLLAETAPGVIEGHAGYHFPAQPAASPLYRVVEHHAAGALHEEPVYVLGRHIRSYYVTPLEGATTASATITAAPASATAR